MHSTNYYYQDDLQLTPGILTEEQINNDLVRVYLLKKEGEERYYLRAAKTEILNALKKDPIHTHTPFYWPINNPLAYPGLFEQPDREDMTLGKMPSNKENLILKRKPQSKAELLQAGLDIDALGTPLFFVPEKQMVLGCLNELNPLLHNNIANQERIKTLADNSENLRALEKVLRALNHCQRLTQHNLEQLLFITDYDEIDPNNSTLIVGLSTALETLEEQDLLIAEKVDLLLAESFSPETDKDFFRAVGGDAYTYLVNVILALNEANLLTDNEIHQILQQQTITCAKVTEILDVFADTDQLTKNIFNLVIREKISDSYDEVILVETLKVLPLELLTAQNFIKFVHSPNVYVTGQEADECFSGLLNVLNKAHLLNQFTLDQVLLAMAWSMKLNESDNVEALSDKLATIGINLSQEELIAKLDKICPPIKQLQLNHLITEENCERLLALPHNNLIGLGHYINDITDTLSNTQQTTQNNSNLTTSLFTQANFERLLTRIGNEHHSKSRKYIEKLSIALENLRQNKSLTQEAFEKLIAASSHKLQAVYTMIKRKEASLPKDAFFLPKEQQEKSEEGQDKEKEQQQFLQKKREPQSRLRFFIKRNTERNEIEEDSIGEESDVDIVDQFMPFK